MLPRSRIDQHGPVTWQSLNHLDSVVVNIARSAIRAGSCPGAGGLLLTLASRPPGRLRAAGRPRPCPPSRAASRPHAPRLRPRRRDRSFLPGGLRPDGGMGRRLGGSPRPLASPPAGLAREPTVATTRPGRAVNTSARSIESSVDVAMLDAFPAVRQNPPTLAPSVRYQLRRTSSFAHFGEQRSDDLREQLHRAQPRDRHPARDQLRASIRDNYVARNGRRRMPGWTGPSS